jgi:hypothetical protein
MATRSKWLAPWIIAGIVCLLIGGTLFVLGNPALAAVNFALGAVLIATGVRAFRKGASARDSTATPPTAEGDRESAAPSPPQP